ncbi:MAG: hypothetical protein M1832_005299 [Thelocarpon impressellum]|nr:MAG: hypothetical protein M1832_005299 [Thelocarpon impressellum]
MATKPTHIAHELLLRAHSPEDAQRIFTEKVKQKPLLLRPTENDGANARELRRRARAKKQEHRKKQTKPKPLSARQKRELNIYAIPDDARRYAIYEPLHRMWVGYIQEVLGQGSLPVTAAAAGSKLCSADFHGAQVEVVRSRCVGRVGLQGIVVKDTMFTFQIITKQNELKIVPKEHSIFRFELPPPGHDLDEKDGPRNLVFEIHGSQFQNRATDRANKKFKQRNLPDL